MSGDDEFEGIGTDGEGIKNLRKAFKETTRLNKELQSRLDALEGKDRTNAIDSALRLRGVDARVAKFYPQDRATTAEAVEEWVEENKDLFGISEENAGPVASSLSPVEIEGYEIVRKIQAAEAATEADFKSRLDKAANKDEVMQVMAEFGRQHTF